jgi:hypothetical protein
MIDGETLEAGPFKKRTIEFVGASVTAGYGSKGSAHSLFS